MSFTKLNELWTKPRIAVLDDQPLEVEALLNHIEKFGGYNVTRFTNAHDFLESIRTKIFPIQMIDVNLSRISNDAEGFRVAAECAAIHPEALRICISKKLSEIPIKEIVSALNPRPQNNLELSVAIALGVRDIWAIFDKNDSGHALRHIIETYRSTVGVSDSVSIFVDEALKKDFDENFSSIPWEQLGVVVEPRLQVVEIVRQLARRPGMPSMENIYLEKLGKGRSKTIVARMRIEFDRSEGHKLHQGVVKERQCIIKIGRIGSIRREISNYSEVLPQIFPAAFYPYIEGSGVSKELAGVAYSCLQDENGKIAPTLLDVLYSNEEILTRFEAINGVKRAFEFKKNQTITLASEKSDGSRLLEVYMNRFPHLQDSKYPHLSAQHGMTTLSETLNEANEILIENQLTVAEGNLRPIASLIIGELRIPICDTIDQMTHPYARWEDFWVGPSHGDLHLDNILLLHQGTAYTNFYIDFADAGLHHVMLDFVIMEIALRFQSLRFLEGRYARQNERNLLHAISALESSILMEDSNPDITLDLPDELHDWILRTQNITLEIRKSAFRFLEIELKPKFETVFGATSKRVRVELESERNRLFCGIGLAALAAIRLAQPSNVERLHRAWFAMLGQTYTNQFNSWRSHQ